MDTKPLTVADPTHPQVEKLIKERVMAAARNAGVGIEVFQKALGVPGTELEDTIVATVARVAKAKPWARYPPIDQWFDLEVDTSINPKAFIMMAGYNPELWTIPDIGFTDAQILRVMLKRFGVANLEAAREAAKREDCYLLAGQARESLKQMYPGNNGHPIIFGGNEWIDGRGRRVVTYLVPKSGGVWRSDFGPSMPPNGFSSDCLFAVVQAA